MSISFDRAGRDDTIATLVLAFALTSRIFSSLTPDQPIYPFILATSALAGGLHFIWVVTAKVFFSFYDRKNGYKKIGSYNYAWSHENFKVYRKKYVSYLRVWAAMLIILIPENKILGASFIIGTTEWYGNESLIYIIFFFSLVITSLLIYETWYMPEKGSRRKSRVKQYLKINRVVNSQTKEWDTENINDLRENHWEDVLIEMNTIQQNTVDIFHVMIKDVKKEQESLRGGNVIQFYFDDPKMIQSLYADPTIISNYRGVLSNQLSFEKLFRSVRQRHGDIGDLLADSLDVDNKYLYPNGDSYLKSINNIFIDIPLKYILPDIDELIGDLKSVMLAIYSNQIPQHELGYSFSLGNASAALTLNESKYLMSIPTALDNRTQHLYQEFKRDGNEQLFNLLALILFSNKLTGKTSTIPFLSVVESIFSGLDKLLDEKDNGIEVIQVQEDLFNKIKKNYNIDQLKRTLKGYQDISHEDIVSEFIELNSGLFAKIENQYSLIKVKLEQLIKDVRNFY